MAGRAIDEMPLWVRFQVLHLCELLIDGEVHNGHFTGGELWSLFILGEIVFHVAMFARDAQRSAVSQIHDQQKSCRRSPLEEVKLDVFEYLRSGLLLVPGNLLRYLLHESIVHFLGRWLLGHL